MKPMSMLLAIVTFCVLALAALGVGAQSLQPTSANYRWHGELVAFDANSRSITVKSRVVGEQAVGEHGRAEQQDPTSHEMGGRGMAIVDALSQRWGCDELPAGKVVWAELIAKNRPHSTSTEAWSA